MLCVPDDIAVALYCNITYYTTRLAIKMPRLNEVQRHEAIDMLRAMPVIDVANRFNCHRATINKLKQIPSDRTRWRLAQNE